MNNWNKLSLFKKQDFIILSAYASERFSYPNSKTFYLPECNDEIDV